MAEVTTVKTRTTKSSNREVISVNIHKNLIYRFLKRSMDIVGGLIGTILLLPITLGIAIARIVKKENDGPIFYDQLRIGKNGRTFKLYKYRSMVVGADDVLTRYLLENEEARKEYNTYKKLKDDPRVTKIGKFIRKTSLDEFPQFINVLKGEMSLVGPRPYLPREKEDMEGYYRTITSIKPGLTGYWQTSGRNDVSFQERLEMDIKYTENMGLWTDIKIIFRTLKKVFFGDGAL